MEHLDQFRGESSVAAWILRIATNHALKTLRKRQLAKTVSLQTPAHPDGDGEDLPHPEFIAQWREDPADLAQRSEVQELIRQALEELDEKYRSVFVLRDVERLSTQETADLLGITPANVKVRLLRARLQLREQLTRSLGDEATQVLGDHEHE
jgi:RNA polymerase sigma-70 factor (ECF subfamily)